MLFRSAAWPMLGFLTKFRADFEAKLAQSPKVRGGGAAPSARVAGATV